MTKISREQLKRSIIGYAKQIAARRDYIIALEQAVRPFAAGWKDERELPAATRGQIEHLRSVLARQSEWIKVC